MSRMDPEYEFFRNLMKDESLKNLLIDIKNMHGEHGDNGDNFLSYLTGATANLFTSIDKAIGCLESVKISMILRGMQISTGIVTDELRKIQPEKMQVA